MAAVGWLESPEVVKRDVELNVAARRSAKGTGRSRAQQVHGARA